MSEPNPTKNIQFTFEDRFFSHESLNCNEPIVFHYTSAHGALGIVDSAELWCTLAYHMNDHTECRYVHEVAMDIAVSMLSTATPEIRSNILGEMRSRFDRISNIKLYVACLTEAGDLLSQWRGYAGPGGYCLGFSLESLKQVSLMNQLFVGDVKYQCKDQHEIVGPIVAELLSSISAVGGLPAEGDAVEKLFEPFILQIARVAPRIKHSAFSEEREWRIYSNPLKLYDNILDFRANSTGIIPFLKLGLDKGHTGEGANLLRDICLRTFRTGPGPNATERQYAITDLVRVKRVRWQLASHSAAPLR
jgi:hypothetical protein